MFCLVHSYGLAGPTLVLRCYHSLPNRPLFICSILDLTVNVLYLNQFFCRYFFSTSSQSQFAAFEINLRFQASYWGIVSREVK